MTPEEIILRAEARYWDRMVPLERYWTDGEHLYRQRSDKPFQEIHQNALWTPIQ